MKRFFVFQLLIFFALLAIPFCASVPSVKAADNPGISDPNLRSACNQCATDLNNLRTIIKQKADTVTAMQIVGGSVSVAGTGTTIISTATMPDPKIATYVSSGIAAAGLIPAFISQIPSLDYSKDLEKYRLKEAHYSTGLTIVYQFPELRKTMDPGAIDKEFTNTTYEYVARRFANCLDDSPVAPVPEMPTSMKKIKLKSPNLSGIPPNPVEQTKTCC